MRAGIAKLIGVVLFAAVLLSMGAMTTFAHNEHVCTHSDTWHQHTGDWYRHDFVGHGTSDRGHYHTYEHWWLNDDKLYYQHVNTRYGCP